MVKTTEKVKSESKGVTIKYSKEVKDEDIFFADVTIDNEFVMRHVSMCKGRKNIARKIRIRYGKDFSSLYIDVKKITGKAIL